MLFMCRSSRCFFFCFCSSLLPPGCFVLVTGQMIIYRAEGERGVPTSQLVHKKNSWARNKLGQFWLIKVNENDLTLIESNIRNVANFGQNRLSMPFLYGCCGCVCLYGLVHRIVCCLWSYYSIVLIDVWLCFVCRARVCVRRTKHM